MTEKNEAIALVNKKLVDMSADTMTLVIDESKTIEKAFGWVFFYNSKEYLLTNDVKNLIAGNGPVFFNKRDNTFIFGHSSKPIRLQIEEYERMIKSNET